MPEPKTSDKPFTIRRRSDDNCSLAVRYLTRGSVEVGSEVLYVPFALCLSDWNKTTKKAVNHSEEKLMNGQRLAEDKPAVIRILVVQRPEAGAILIFRSEIE